MCNVAIVALIGACGRRVIAFSVDSGSSLCRTGDLASAAGHPARTPSEQVSVRAFPHVLFIHVYNIYIYIHICVYIYIQILYIHIYIYIYYKGV